MKTIPQAFEHFRKYLELTEKQRSDAVAQHTRVRGVLEQLDGYQTSFLTGSYKRRTCLRPLDDIDFFVVVEGQRSWSSWNGKPVEAPDALLKRVRAALDKEWPTKDKPKLQMRSINVDFKGTGIGYDAVPAYKASSGSGYWIPDREAGWIRSDPTVHEANLTEANRNTDGRLVPLVKFIKQWRRVIKKRDGSVPFSSFHLETLCVQRHRGFFATALPRERAEGLAVLFDHLARTVADVCPDPADLGPPLNQGMDGAAARRLCKAAAATASLAQAAGRRREDATAHQLWGELLGPGYAFR